MKPSERIQEIIKKIIPQGLKVENTEDALVLMGYGIQGVMDYLDEEYKKEQDVLQRSVQVDNNKHYCSFAPDGDPCRICGRKPPAL